MKIAPQVKKNPHVHAMWLEGSYATGDFNEQSDIDVWLDVDDGTVEYCAKDFRKNISKVIGINSEESYKNYSIKPKLSKYTFYLNEFPKEQAVELDIQEHNRMFKFTKGENVIKVLFDKDGSIQWKDSS